MSRTYKDRPSKIRFPVEIDYFWVNDSVYRKYLKGVKTKKKKHFDTEYRWLRNRPSWFTHEFIETPHRRKGRHWEHEVVRLSVEDVDTLDYVGAKSKDKLYYW